MTREIGNPYGRSSFQKAERSEQQAGPESTTRVGDNAPLQASPAPLRDVDPGDEAPLSAEARDYIEAKDGDPFDGDELWGEGLEPECVDCGGPTSGHPYLCPACFTMNAHLRAESA